MVTVPLFVKGVVGKSLIVVVGPAPREMLQPVPLMKSPSLSLVKVTTPFNVSAHVIVVSSLSNLSTKSTAPVYVPAFTLKFPETLNAVVGAVKVPLSKIYEPDTVSHDAPPVKVPPLCVYAVSTVTA